MTTPKQPYNLRQTKSFDYWYDIIMGGLLTSGILISIGGLILLTNHLTFWFYSYATLCVAIIAYFQWHDDNFTIIKTGLSKAKNYSLVTECLDSLNWHYDKKTTHVDLTLNKYILKFLRPTIIPESDNIYINFQYDSTTKTGRLPFFFGISTYLEWKFKRSINKQLLQKPTIDLNVDR
jgi:hypothetical protein